MGRQPRSPDATISVIEVGAWGAQKTEGRMATIESTTEIRPFSVEVPEEDLADLRTRIAATRWPERETVADETQGTGLRRRPRRQPHTSRGPRQHHPHLGDQHRGFLGSSLLGEHARLLRRQGRQGANGYQRLLARALSGAPELGRAGLPQSVYFNEVDEGNHFAGWQEPELFTQELRAAFSRCEPTTTKGGHHEHHRRDRYRRPSLPARDFR